MAGLLDYLGYGSGMPGLQPEDFGPEIGLLGGPTRMRMRTTPGNQLGRAAGLGDISVREPVPPMPPPPLPPAAGQPGYLPPIQGQGLPAGATPFPTGPDPNAMPGQPSGGLLAGGYGGGPMGVPPALLENRPPAAAPPAAPSSAVPPDLLARIGGFLNQHSNQLMGMGAGFAGGRSLGEGVSKALTGAMAGRQADIGQSSQNATYDALVNKGVPPAQAMSAIGNPEMLKTLLAKHFSIPEFKTITNPITGQSQLVLTDAAAGTAQAPTALPAGKSGTYRGRQAVFQNGQWYYTD